MYADLEELVLSGKLFNGADSGPSSPVRSRSPSPQSRWPHTNPDYESPPEDEDDVLDELESTTSPRPTRTTEPPRESIGMMPGRTGVKGVIRDRDEAVSIENSRKAKEIKELNEKMERSNLGGLTYLEEKALDEKEAAKALEEERKYDDIRERHRLRVELRQGEFGYLREVGFSNFVNAIEKERPGVWVVVHLYDNSLERCAQLDLTLGRLAKSNPSVKFIRSKAGALGFASLASHTDPEEDEEPVEEPVDTDMLPTVLVYRDGELVHNWVRVDFVIKDEISPSETNIGPLLEKYDIIPRPSTSGFDPSRSFPEVDDDDDDSLEIEFDHDLDY